MSISCPFCDSYNVEKIVVDETFPIPFCGDTIIQHETYRCNDCEEEGDFDLTLDKALTRLIDKANIASAPKLMDELNEAGITMTYLEKALRLPFRTTSRWKRGRISRSSLALLRLIRFSPSLLAVADDDFSQASIARYQCFSPLDFFEKNTTNPGCSVTYDNNTLGLSFQGTLFNVEVSAGGREVEWEQIR
ncbi:hypothetical protein [Trichlorobacter lovleyi]|uniref:hypothetical protein n=1 Tax=Trichlorobacter lovleyi TaxID=313985 RepID=UPI0024818E61|nr:hypothetical protein [Trichlorobacter lovleyi]